MSVIIQTEHRNKKSWHFWKHDGNKMETPKNAIKIHIENAVKYIYSKTHIKYF